MEVQERQRTADVLRDDAMRAFSELLLPQHLLLTLREAGYERPSPVQARVRACRCITPVLSCQQQAALSKSRETNP